MIVCDVCACGVLVLPDGRFAHAVDPAEPHAALVDGTDRLY